MATQLSSRAWIADRGALAAPRRSCSGVRRQQRLQAHATTLLDTLLKPVLDIGEVLGSARSGVWQRARAAAAACRCCRRLPAHSLPCPGSTPQRKPLKEGIANFYDESSQLWESMWVSLPLAAPWPGPVLARASRPLAPLRHAHTLQVPCSFDHSLHSAAPQ